MKKPHDIRLLGIGLVVGMVLGYFISSETPSTTTGPAPMTLAQAAPASPNGQATTPRQVVEWFDGPTNYRLARPKNLFSPAQLPTRYIHNPAVPGEWGASPAMRSPNVPVYDLIDFKYVPDFQLP